MSQVERTLEPQLESGAVALRRVARVDLLPTEIVEARRLKRTQTGLAGGLVALVAVVGGVYALQVHSKNQAADQLAATKAETVRLQNAQKKYADVPLTIAAIDAADIARATAMQQDVEWYRSLNNFALTVPSNVWFTKVSVGLTPANATTTATAPTPTTPTTTATPAPTGPTTMGLLTVEGMAMTHPDVATWLDVLARQPGMDDAYFSTAAKAKIGAKSVVKFSSTADVTSDALSHRYDRNGG